MRIVVFWDEGFPFVDAPAIAKKSLLTALDSKHTVRFATATEIPKALAENPDLFVNPYGSAFPKSTWRAFTQYLERGSNWVNLGGAPLTRPVRRVDDGQWTTDDTPLASNPSSDWHIEVPQTQYGKELRINHAFPIALPPAQTLSFPGLDVDLETHFGRFRPTRAWSLQVRFTDSKDFPEESGSAGPREAVMRPLVLSRGGERVLAAPIVSIDRLLGRFAGGRWVLACCYGEGSFPVGLIERLCEFAMRPRADLRVQPGFACYYPGEFATLNVCVRARGAGDLKVNLRVYSQDNQQEIYAHTYRVSVDHATAPGSPSPSRPVTPSPPQLYSAPAMIQTSPFPAGNPGLYIVKANVEGGGRNKPIGHAETGFWIYDRDLISSGKPLTADRDYFHRDGQPYPITGTTYTAGDAHRKFLFEPNPAVWDADFFAMAAAGVNMVRTGIWTGWKRAMLDAGAVDEGVLRAFAAFLLTARRYNIPVIFTFFSFLPESWGGKNPYLDPQAVAAQSAFVAAFARRFANVNDLLWDLINEPSFCSPERQWKTRPNYDEFEQAAWTEWLANQGVGDDEWRERWRLTPNDPLDLPALEDFEDRYIFQDTHPIRVMDYRRFAQEMFTEWTRKLVRVIRGNGNPHQLVTVGQDEGGTRDRPNPWFHGKAVDFTCNHSWWQNDDILWDSVITKTPDRPNLIEETGIMFVEGVDGSPWRTPEECRNLLERKMALSFAAGCAGFIQWCWNTNVYMDSDNEVAIGFLRADGSEKPELESFRKIARFIAANAHLMTGRKPEEAAVVIPHSNMFSVRNLADQATRRAVRILECDLGIPCRAISEHRVDEIGDPKLIVLPSPRVLTEACWQTLLKKVESGATLLVTGFVEADEYWRNVDRLTGFSVKTHSWPVTRSERSNLAERPYPASSRFSRDAIQRLDCAITEDGDRSLIRSIKLKKGTLIVCPQPLELDDYDFNAAWLYTCALNTAQKRTRSPGEFPEHDLLVRREAFDVCDLLIFVSESSSEERCGGPGPRQIPFGLRIPPQRIGLAFVDAESGKVLAKLEME